MILIMSQALLIYVAIHMIFWPIRSLSYATIFRVLCVGFFACCLGEFGLWRAFLSNDTSIDYVYRHGKMSLKDNIGLGLLWAGHEGANFFFLTVLIFSALAVLMPYRQHSKVVPTWGRSYLAYHIGGLILLILWLSSPFERLWPFPPASPKELNPLLQDYALTYHPPLLLGSTALFFTVAIGDVFHKKIPGGFSKRYWWLSHNLGLLLLGMSAGGYWAYHVLGWGGWWFWDPVETISFFTFLGGLALLHQHHSGKKLAWFHGPFVWACILLTLWMVRSSQITSVHSFISNWSEWPWLIFALGSYAFSFMHNVHSHTGSVKPQLIGIEVLWGVVLFGLVAPIIAANISQPFHLSPVYYEQNLFHALVFFLAYRAHNKYGTFLSGIWLIQVICEPNPITTLLFLGLILGLYIIRAPQKISTWMHTLVLSFLMLCGMQKQYSIQQEMKVDELSAFADLNISRQTQGQYLSPQGHECEYIDLVLQPKNSESVSLRIEKKYLPTWQQEISPIIYWRDPWGHDYGFCMGGRQGYIKMLYRPYMQLLLWNALGLGVTLWIYGLWGLRGFWRARHC